MKKIYLFAFSLVCSLLFYFVLLDATTLIARVSFIFCLVLSVANLANSVFLLRENQRLGRLSPPWVTYVFTINLVIFSLFAIYVLAAYFLPYSISVG